MRHPKELLRKWRRVCAAFLLALPLAACDRSDSSGPKSSDRESPVGHSHGKGRETCFICNATKREPGRLWCQEHRRYEDRCWICQPQLEVKDRSYCREHSLYEDECFLCNPELMKGLAEESEREEVRKTRGQKESDADDLFCREHRVMERECGICQPQLARSLRPGESLKVRFKSKLSAWKAGIQTASPRPSESRPGFAAFCEVRYNEDRVARITPLASGIVRRVLADVGAEVKAGEVLVEIHSAEIAAAKTAFISAIVDHGLKDKACKREELLVERKISAEREFQEAQAACELAGLTTRTARQKLLNYGLTGSQIVNIEKTQDGSALFEIRAPYAGTLVERKAVVGEAVEPGDALFTLADISEVWLELSVPGDRVGVIEEGLTVEATFENLPGFEAKGTITWVGTSLDGRSRMVTARAVIPNPDGKLKVRMFGKARVMLRGVTRSLRLPKSAVQRYERHPYVFVKMEEDLYALRRILLGSGTDRSIDVLQGIRLDEQVVVQGTFTVMSEFLKSRLGAGCVDE